VNGTEPHKTAVLAQIAAEALEAVNEDSVYQAAANALKEHLGLYNVALFAYDKRPTRVDFEGMSGSIRRGLVTRLPPVRRCGFDRTFSQDRRTCFGQRCHTPPLIISKRRLPNQ
jgi:hypothetical protein